MKLHRSDFLLIIVLVLVAVAIRLPYRGQYLYHWDSVNFALSLENYDVRLHQPQPPGYFFYSAMGAAFNVVIADANASLVWLSLVSGGLGVVTLYWLGAVMFNRQVGLAAALLTLTNPMQWFYSEVALSYSVEFVLVTLIAGLCYLQLTGRERVWPVTVIVLGLAGGVRQNDLAFLVPLWLVSLYPLSWRGRLGSIGLLAVVSLAWALPMVALSGGLNDYLEALGGGGGVVAEESPLFSAAELALNVGRMALYLGYGTLLAAIPLLWGGWALARNARKLLADRRAWVFFLWIAPAFAFYIFVHLRQHGHIFTFLPAVILLAALAVMELAKRLGKTEARQVMIGRVLTGTLVVVNALFFLLAPASLLGSSQVPLQTPSRQTIQSRDALLEEHIAYVQAHFDPAETVILAGGYNYRHPEYYLSDFQETDLSYRVGDDLVELPGNVHTLVLFDDVVLPDLPEDAGFVSVAMPDGSTIRSITWNTDQAAWVSLNDFQLR
jgi:hypothetical protein